MIDDNISIFSYTVEPSDRVSDIVEQPEQTSKYGEEAPNCSETDDQDNSEKPSSSIKEDTSIETCKQPMAKRKKMSHFEKGIALMCKTLNETSEKEMERLDSYISTCKQPQDSHLYDHKGNANSDDLQTSKIFSLSINHGGASWWEN
jgi:hypothetical protein